MDNDDMRLPWRRGPGAALRRGDQGAPYARGGITRVPASYDTHLTAPETYPDAEVAHAGAALARQLMAERDKPGDPEPPF